MALVNFRGGYLGFSLAMLLALNLCMGKDSANSWNPSPPVPKFFFKIVHFSHFPARQGRLYTISSTRGNEKISRIRTRARNLNPRKLGPFTGSLCIKGITYHSDPFLPPLFPPFVPIVEDPPPIASEPPTSTPAAGYSSPSSSPPPPFYAEQPTPPPLPPPYRAPSPAARPIPLKPLPPPN